MDSTENNNNVYSNYSKIDGKSSKDIENDKFTMKKNDNLHCKICEKDNSFSSTYCKFCGNDLNEIVTLNEAKGKLKFKEVIKNDLAYLNLKNIILTSGLAVIMLLLVAIGFKFMISNQFKQISNSINLVHILLGLNLGTVNVSTSTMMGSSSVSAKFGLLLSVILPIVAMIISNFIFMKKPKKDSKSNLIDSIGVGIVYGGFLGILCIFTNVRANPHDLFQYGYSLGFSYKFLSLFINGFIIGFLSTYFIGLRKEHIEKNIYLGIFRQAFKIIFLGYILIFILLGMLSISNSNYLMELGLSSYIGKLGLGVVLTQLSIYVWSFANLIPVNIGVYKLSVIDAGGTYLMGDSKLIFCAMVALSALILLIAGCKLKSKYKKEGIKSVLTLAISYSIFMGILSMFTTIQLTTYSSSTYMGFSLITTLIISFIYSFIMSFVGYKLNTFTN
ncbi:hypothetical protein CHF27_002750 [Romboutsia maritimum]|uniref:Uncharacterized protein n=1 Tax=Romboutsia maritimum TaxID=2020948 RepID=A0A371IVT6_9FIRM|nr:hypothetical protein [Romboutsia maritimum]RDY24578.1 hypothetical protein CHF27_002750 [Romboutsia maritimum]